MLGFNCFKDQTITILILISTTSWLGGIQSVERKTTGFTDRCQALEKQIFVDLSCTTAAPMKIPRCVAATGVLDFQIVS
jgi:hypothetical protein